MLNRWTGIGHLGQDPELRSTGGGQSVASLRLATTDRYKDKEGKWIDRTEWHSVVVWGRTAENVAKFCKKGKQIYVEGRLATRKWQDKEGKDRYTTEIVADSVQFLGGAGGQSEGGGYGGGQQSRPADSGRGGSAQDDRDVPFGGDDDVPF